MHQRIARREDRWQQEREWAYSARVYPRLARRYPNRWIAVARHRVIASGTNVAQVLAQAHRKVKWPEIPLVYVERGIHVYLNCPPDGHRARSQAVP